MDPEQPTVGDLGPHFDTDSGFLLHSTETLHLPPVPTYATYGQVGYTHGQESISYPHSFQHHSSASQHQQPPLSLPLQLSEDVDSEDSDTMQQSSDDQQPAEQLPFVITATDEFKCTFSECKTQPVFKRKCDLTKHQNNHKRAHKCLFEGECRYKGGAEVKDLHRHYWSHHPVWAKDKKIPREETVCDFPGCNYKGRKDNVRRHKIKVGHDREQP